MDEHRHLITLRTALAITELLVLHLQEFLVTLAKTNNMAANTHKLIRERMSLYGEISPLPYVHVCVCVCVFFFFCVCVCMCVFVCVYNVCVFCVYFCVFVTGIHWTGLHYWTGLLDWTTGLDYWTGLLDWTTGLDYWTGLLDWTTGLTLELSFNDKNCCSLAS